MNLKDILLSTFVNKIDTSKIVEEVGDYGYLIYRKEHEKIVNEKGNIEYKLKTVYNIVSKNNELICDKWFDKYITLENGICIYGILKTANEYEDTMDSCIIIPEEQEDMKYKYGAINRFGEHTVEAIYDGLAFSTEDTLIAVSKGNLGFVDLLTGKQITPIIFPRVFHFSEGLAEVEWNGFSGFIDRNVCMTNPDNFWEYKIAPIYTEAGSFENGVSEVEFRGERFFINKDGLKITKETARLLKKNNKRK